MSTPINSGRQVELSIGGMTCVSCAARIERKLNELDGVVATVNLATERARVSYPESVCAEDLLSTVELLATRLGCRSRRLSVATMDTLVSMGTLAAFGWSLYALFLGTVGEPGMRHRSS